MQVAPVGNRVSTPRQRQSWVPPRRTIGTLGLLLSLAGVFAFFWLVARYSADHGVTPRHTASAVAVIVGLQIARWAFDSQAAANREELYRQDLAEVVIRQERAVGKAYALAGEQHAHRRPGRRKRSAASGATDNVIPLRARQAKDALRRLTERLTGEPNA